MRNSRRMKRMGRSKKKLIGLNLTPLMDVFTILVFFLLFHSSGGDILQTPSRSSLPGALLSKPSQGKQW